jgi:hypothetical protein
MEWAEHEARTGETRNAYKILVEKNKTAHSEDLGVDGRIMAHRKIGWEGTDWIHLV